jgi:hypothetical protein
MMGATSDQPKWSRQVVNTLPLMDWATLQQGARPWLWLSGAHSETLEQDVQKIAKSFDYFWVWRDTPWEYGSPGYREGPLLVPLDEQLFTFARDHWLRCQAGLILLGPDDETNLVAHLQHLHQLTGADGFPIAFSLHAVRPLEELCEGLPADRLSQLFGPIQRLIWYAGDVQSGEWLSANAPLIARTSSITERPIALTVNDEATLGQASLAWFMRDFARDVRQRFPAYDRPENEPVLWRHLNLFAREATDQLALATERDVRHYMELRFQYSHELFAKDLALRDILVNLKVQGKQRLTDAEARLAALATTMS